LSSGVGRIRHGEQGRERKKGVRANMTYAGGGESLKLEAPPPPQREIYKHCREFKNWQLKMRFSQNVLEQFFYPKICLKLAEKN
jgi:hypothetical protein